MKPKINFITARKATLVRYFIKFFESIPDEKWTTGSVKRGDGTCCALGLVGCRETKSRGYSLPRAARALIRIMSGCTHGQEKHNFCNVYKVNDCSHVSAPQTPRARILNALRELL